MSNAHHTPPNSTLISDSNGHVPVLLNEVLAGLLPSEDATSRLFVDGTLGAGGHSEAILSRLTPAGRLIGVDQDPVALDLAARRLASFGNQLEILRGNFSELEQLLGHLSPAPITGGLLVDLGVSSMQLDTAERGFSFGKEAPLDMRMSPDTHLTAATVVNTYTEQELRRIFFDYGEERLTGPITRAILRRRDEKPFESTLELANLIRDQYVGHGLSGSGGKGKKQGKGIHPATRVFQAIRIEVNDELGHLRRLLDSLPRLLAPGAKVAIISFHSLEDRLIKQAFKDASRECICPPRFPICQCSQKASLKPLPGKPIIATDEEIRLNPRSRSAKLRVATRL